MVIFGAEFFDERRQIFNVNLVDQLEDILVDLEGEPLVDNAQLELDFFWNELDIREKKIIRFLGVVGLCRCHKTLIIRR